MCAKKLKTNKNYYFSVEGDTEGWYLDYLQKLINNCSKATCTVKLKHKKLMPTRYAKTLANITEEEVYHLCDYESDSEDDVKKFHKILDDMKEVSKINNSLKYKLGYSNFTFELWIILHKKDLKGPLTDKKQYLKYINEIFDENFKSLDEYKEEKNFKRVVEQITLEDIINAIKRAEKIRDHNKEYNKQIKYGKYIYYKENPDLEINESIEKILNDCEIL